MKLMTGEIGKLELNGEQVGGFKYWTAIQNRDTNETKVIASKFWTLRKLDNGKYTAEFYSRVEDKLELIYKAPVEIEFPEHEVNKTMTKQITLDLGKFDRIQGMR
jgi:hypothetical protein